MRASRHKFVAALAGFVLVTTTSAVAASVTLQCTIRGKSVSDFGRLAVVTVDLEALTVEVETLEKCADGAGGIARVRRRPFW